jgi:hypothetical protein
MMEFDPIHDIIANNSPLMFVLGVACYVTFILCLPNSSVSWQRIASVPFSFLSLLLCLYLCPFFCFLFWWFIHRLTLWYGTVRKRPDRHIQRRTCTRTHMHTQRDRETHTTMLVAPWQHYCFLLPLFHSRRAGQGRSGNTALCWVAHIHYPYPL